MKNFLKRVLIATIVLGPMTMSQGSSVHPTGVYDPLSGFTIEEVSTTARSYHGATHDSVTGEQEDPFGYTKSNLGRAIRATKFLLGYVYAAAEDNSIREQILEDTDAFFARTLNFYVLCFQAQSFVRQHIDVEHEKSSYLLRELEQLRRGVLLLAHNFAALAEDEPHNRIALCVGLILDTIAKQTGQILAE